MQMNQYSTIYSVLLFLNIVNYLQISDICTLIFKLVLQLSTWIDFLDTYSDLFFSVYSVDTQIIYQ